MRKLKLQVQMTMDGFMAGPNGEMDWVSFDWGDDLKQFVSGMTDDVDCILLGRNLAEGFIPHWAGVAADDQNPEQAAGQLFTDTAKVVFSHKLDQSKWDNTVVATGDLVEEVTQLKEQDGGEMIVYGGGTFVSNLIKQQLIDELYLFVNPVAIGQGMAIFKGLTEKRPFRLVNTIGFDCGIVLLHYAL